MFGNTVNRDSYNFNITARITDKTFVRTGDYSGAFPDDGGTWVYDWTEQFFDNETGEWIDADPGREGYYDAEEDPAYVTPAIERNNREVQVGTYVRMDVRGSVLGQPSYVFDYAVRSPTPTTTTGAGSCYGNCKWTYSQDTKVWDIVSSACGAVCSCGFCGGGASRVFEFVLAGGTGDFATANAQYFNEYSTGCVWEDADEDWVTTVTKLSDGWTVTAANAGIGASVTYTCDGGCIAPIDCVQTSIAGTGTAPTPPSVSAIGDSECPRCEMDCPDGAPRVLVFTLAAGEGDFAGANGEWRVEFNGGCQWTYEDEEWSAVGEISGETFTVNITGPDGQTLTYTATLERTEDLQDCCRTGALVNTGSSGEGRIPFASNVTAGSPCTQPRKCSCLAPTYCPPVSESDPCTYTMCGAMEDNQEPPNCTGTTTTAGGGGGCSTTTASGCTLGCDFYCHPVRGWELLRNGCLNSCPCPFPSEPCGPGSYCGKASTACVQEPVYCSGSCSWVWLTFDDRDPYWELASNGCSSLNVPSCGCDRPTAPGSECGGRTSTPCYSPTPTGGCGGPTTTTGGPGCSGNCLWGTDGETWSVIRSCPGCTCNSPLRDPAESCEQVETYRCHY